MGYLFLLIPLFLIVFIVVVFRKAVKSAPTEQECENILRSNLEKSLKDPDYKVRLSAVQQLTDQELLASILKTEVHGAVREAAVCRLSIQDVLTDVAQNDKFTNVRRAAIGKITDKKILADIAKNEKENELIIKEALERLHSEDVIIDVAKNRVCHWQTFGNAVRRVTNQHTLACIAKNSDVHSGIRTTAIGKLNAQHLDLLTKLEKEDNNDSVREEASLRYRQLTMPNLWPEGYRPRSD